jgi:tRNA dimethylallyltransferase
MSSRAAKRSAGDHRAFFLVGPTATGKTAVAQAVAERQGWGILSADSMLVYRGMDIGTAKPTREERRRATHWGLDLATPGERFSAGDYLDAARAAFGEAGRAGQPVLVAGGTGLYVKCLTHGLDAKAGADAAARADAERLLRERGLAALQEALREADPAAYRGLKDSRNPRRLVRALELARVSARPARRWADRRETAPMAGLRMEPALLARRIAERVRGMYEGGLLEEVEALRARFPAFSETARHAIGYAEAVAVLDRRMSLEEAMEKTGLRTRRLAKRQMTWFRHQARVEWVTVLPGMAAEDLADRVLSIWRKHGPSAVCV